MHPFKFMRLHNLGTEGIIHVGANIGQERAGYQECRANACLWIEPVSAVFDQLKENIKGMPGHVAVRAVCSNVAGEVVSLNIASNRGNSSSLLPLGNHARLHPDVTYVGSESMTTRILDEIVQTEAPDAAFNLLVVDVQGAELKVLHGAMSVLSRLDAVYIEVSETPLYEGGCTIDDITGFLRGFGFAMKWMSITRYGWGNAMYMRLGDRPLPPPPSANIALGRPATQSSTYIVGRSDDAQGGNNGVRTGGFGFHTHKEKYPWWQVDLGHEQQIREVRVFNRMDEARERAVTLRVLLSTDGTAWHLVYDRGGWPFGGIDGRPLRVFPQDMTSRFVRLQLHDNEFLHLDEVEVY